MKIKATKTMATALNKAMKNSKFSNYKITLEKLGEHEFAWCVDLDIYKHEVDYNIEDGTFNVLKVVYPQDYYACSRYLTTSDLARIYKCSDKTYDGFMQAVIESIEI